MRSAAAAALFHAALGYALLTGLGVDFTPPQERRLAVFDIANPPPPPPLPDPTPPPERRQEREEGAASPENLKSKATPVVAPPPAIKLDPPPTVIAAPKPSTGAETSTGASDKTGPGTGAGGIGDGTGAGGSGNGTGGGGGAKLRARWTGGSISDSDYPRAASRARAGGTVIARLAIGANGRVERCTVTQSSGNDDLDAATCRLIERRFRYAPARDPEGRAIPDTLGWRQRWWLEPRRSKDEPAPADEGLASRRPLG